MPDEILQIDIDARKNLEGGIKAMTQSLQEFQRVRPNIDQFSKQFRELGDIMSSPGGLIRAGISLASTAAENTIAFGEGRAQLQLLSNIMHMSTREATAFELISRKAGETTEQARAGMKSFADTMTDLAVNRWGGRAGEQLKAWGDEAVAWGRQLLEVAGTRNGRLYVETLSRVFREASPQQQEAIAEFHRMPLPVLRKIVEEFDNTIAKIPEHNEAAAKKSLEIWLDFQSQWNEKYWVPFMTQVASTLPGWIQSTLSVLDKFEHFLQTGRTPWYQGQTQGPQTQSPTSPTARPQTLQPPGTQRIPGFQHGGIVTRPTIGYLGERGPEMVIPLRGVPADTRFATRPGSNLPLGGNQQDLSQQADDRAVLMREVRDSLQRMEERQRGGGGEMRGTSLGRYGATGAPGGGMGPIAGGPSEPRRGGGQASPDFPVDQSGKPVDSETVAALSALAARHETGAMQRLMHDRGYRVDSAWCGDLAHALTQSSGYASPKGYPIASNWRKWGEHVDGSAINVEGRPFGSIVASKTNVPIGQTGGHVMTIVPGTYDPKTNSAVVIDTVGKRRRSLDGFEVRYSGDDAVKQAQERAALYTPRPDVPPGTPVPKDRPNIETPSLPTRRGEPGGIDGGAPRGGVGGLRESRRRFGEELNNDPQLRERLYRLAQLEDQSNPQAFMESIMNRAAARKMSLRDAINQRAYYPDSLRKMAGGGGRGYKTEAMQQAEEAVLGGSNRINFGTGNASGPAGFGYGRGPRDPTTWVNPDSKERYGVENQRSDIRFAEQQRAANRDTGENIDRAIRRETRDSFMEKRAEIRFINVPDHVRTNVEHDGMDRVTTTREREIERPRPAAEEGHGGIGHA
jgi:hypothetical protein